MEKHCNTCRYSYEAVSFSGKSMGQHCNSPHYNSEDYSNKELMEDWGDGHCRFWEQKEDDNDQA